MNRLVWCLLVLVTACGGGGDSGSAGAAGGGGVTTNPPSTYSVAGVVAASSGAALPSVQLTLSGAASSATVSDANGAYSFTGLSNGNYSVSPSAAGQTFTPASAAVSVQGSSIAGVNFAQVAQSLPSTQKISEYMAIRHSQALSAFALSEGALNATLAAQGLFNSGGHYTKSGQDYVALVQSFANDSLAFVRTQSAIDRSAVSSLFSTYASQDAAYADTYYRGVTWGLSASGLSTFIAGINKQTNDIYAIAILQLP